MLGLEIPIKDPRIQVNNETLIRYIEELILDPGEPWMLAHLQKESEGLYSLAEYACGAIDSFKASVNEELFVYDIVDIKWLTDRTLFVKVMFTYEQD